MPKISFRARRYTLFCTPELAVFYLSCLKGFLAEDTDLNFVPIMLVFGAKINSKSILSKWRDLYITIKVVCLCVFCIEELVVECGLV